MSDLAELLGAAVVKVKKAHPMDDLMLYHLGGLWWAEAGGNRSVLLGEATGDYRSDMHPTAEAAVAELLSRIPDA